MTEPATHPFAVFGPAPYVLVGFEDTDARADLQRFRENAGLTFTTNLCGGSCDLCGTAIWNVYIFEAANGRRFRVGCDCADKAGEGAEAKAGRRRIAREEGERRASFAREEREALERERNLVEVGEALTDAEVAYWRRTLHDLEMDVERVSSRHVGSVGDRIKSIEVRYDGYFAFESFYGVKRIYRFRTRDGAALVWFTTSGLAHQRPDGGTLEEGQWIRIAGTVKKHGEYRDEQQTELTRVKELS